MGRKKKIVKEFEANRTYINQCAPYFASEEEKLFACLLVCGYSSAHAYRISHPESKASVSSSAVLGSRLLREGGVQTTLRLIIEAYWDGFLSLKEDMYRERRKRRSWEPPKKKRITPPDSHFPDL